jgi:hypothetical protein
MKPTIWHVVYRDARDWLLEQRGELLLRFDYRDDAIREGQLRARLLASQGDQTKLLIHRADGSIEKEMCFGQYGPTCVAE